MNKTGERPVLQRGNVMRLHELWWRALPFTFAVSTLAPSKVEWLPQCRTLLYFPLGLAEPRKHKTRVWATNFLARWAESGGWCFERSVEWPSFGCLSSKQKPFIVSSSRETLTDDLLFRLTILIWTCTTCKCIYETHIYTVFGSSGYPRP